METSRAKQTVIVVGGGLAGLSAAIEAHRAGSNVVLVEKQPRLGGNSALASSGINAVNTEAQKREGSRDTFEAFIHDTINSGGQTGQSAQLVHILVNESPSAVDFLGQFGVDLSLITQCGAHSFARTHRAKPREDGKPENVGWHIMGRMVQTVQGIPTSQMRVVTGARVTRILRDNDGAVVGIRFSSAVEGSKQEKEANIFADSVVLATGGYSADKLLLQEFGTSDISEMPTTNGPWAQGDGVKLARQVGAELVDMDKVQLHPTGIVDPNEPFALKKWLAPEAFRGCGGLLLNSKGERFVNELGGRDAVTEKIFQHCSKLEHKGELKEGERVPVIAYLVMNDEVARKFDLKMFDFYKGKGFIHTVPNAQEFANHIHADYESVKKSLEEYSAIFHQTGERKDRFGKTVFPTDFKLDEPLHVVIVTPSIHYTMGGVRISDRGEVLTKDNVPIAGLFAAGEVTGGVHGKNRLAGNSLLECVVFGRRAGLQASKFIGKANTAGITRRPDFVDEDGVYHRAALRPDSFVPLRLKERFQLNKTSHVFSFELPNASDHSGLLAGQYIGVRAILQGKEVIRFYSPISRNSSYGKIELLVKIETDKLHESSMTYYLNLLQPGSTLEFKGPLGGFEYHRNTYRELGLLAGGTGISPAMQVMRSVAAHPEDTTQIKILYGNYLEDDILCKEELAYLSSTRTNIHSYITLNNPPPRWSMGTGFIDEEMIRKYLPAPAKDIKILMCGPVPMIKAMWVLLRKIGYTDDMVFSYI